MNGTGKPMGHTCILMLLGLFNENNKLMNNTKMREFLKEIFRKDTPEEMENCDGYKESQCCGAPIVDGVCQECKEPTNTECKDCESAGVCPNAKLQ